MFNLVYTDVKSYSGAFKDTPNYLVTAEQIEGPWSDPIYLNSSGFDPSMFHDDDGRKWLVNMQWDYRTNRKSFAGIVLQEYSVQEQRLIGQPRLIFPGTSLGFTEAPHLYKRKGYYYLLVVEGGTSYGKWEELKDSEVDVPEGSSCKLKVVIEAEQASFYYSVQDGQWQQVGQALDILHLSDEGADGKGVNRFTGNFIGLCVQDLSGMRVHADFDYFRYVEFDDDV